MMIRDATPADWPRIWPFWHRIAEAGDTYAWHPDTTSEQAERLWLEPPPGRVFVVEDASDLVGSAQLHPNYGPASRIGNASFIVDPDRSGQGIGRALVNHTINAARSAGYRAMVFNAVVETNLNAVHLYETLGFSILTTVPEAFDHPVRGPVGLHVMYLRL